jgi:hypothetical protein
MQYDILELPSKRGAPAPETLTMLEDPHEYNQFQPHSSHVDRVHMPEFSVLNSTRTFPSSDEASRPPRGSLHRALPSGQRFVAGDAFFNYETFGSLRPEFVPIRLFSTAFLGLAVNALAAGFVITLSKYAFRQLLGEYLRIHDDSYATSISFLLEWPGSFSVFIGFLSDCRPIGGRRRRPYMIIGWIAAFVLFLLIGLVDFTLARSWYLLDWRHEPDPATLAAIHTRVTRYGGLLIALAILARLAVQLMYIASLSMTVEFAQREPLRERGKLQATYFVLFYVMAAFAQAISTAFVLADDDGHVRSKISLGWTSCILAIACLVPLPFIVTYLDEPTVDQVTVHFSVRRRIHELWRFCHQNVSIRVLTFLIVHFFLIGLYNKNGRTAIAKWCHITESKIPAVNAVSTTGYCLSLTFWIAFMVNWSWRRIAGIGTVAFILGYITFTALVVYNVARYDWFYILIVAVLDMPTAWIRLYAVVLSTEIAENGREGVTMGLVYASQLMVGVSAHMLSAGLGQWLPFRVTSDDMLADSNDTRHQVFTGSMVVFGINVLAVFVVLVLPQQKLDAQQMRAFGGYNRYASYGVAILFGVLFCGNFAMNTLALTR